MEIICYYSASLLILMYIVQFLGYNFGSINIKGYSHRWNGVNICMVNLSDNLSVSVLISETKTGEARVIMLIGQKSFLRLTGINIAKGDANAFEYSEAKDH